MNRKHFLDNIRWVTVLLVLLYHVVYFYNNKGVFGGIGGWVDDPKAQPQDVIMYILYPWFMMLLFLVAGISSRYAIQKSSRGQWFKKRTRQLLVPATIGLFVFQWMTGYFNTQIAGVAQGIPNQIASIPPGPIRYMACAFSGIGPLWFIQELWVFCLLLTIIVAIERDRLYNAVGRLLQSTRGWSKPCRLALLLVGGFLLIWAGAQGSIPHPDEHSAQGLWNLYRPAAYLVPFLMGYYLFSRDSVQRFLSRYAYWLLVPAVAAGVALTLATEHQPLCLAGNPCHAGLLQGLGGPHHAIRLLHDPQQLWHLHCPLPHYCRPRLYAQTLHLPAACGRLSHIAGGSLHPLPSSLRAAAPHPPGPLGSLRHRQIQSE